MDNKKIRHITSDYFRKFKKDFKAILIGFDAEAIHQYRVHYKKLRAFLRMLSPQDKTAKIKITGKLKRTYRYAGAIRDLQLLEQKLSKAIKPDDKSPAFCFYHMLQEMNKWKRLFGKTANDTMIDAAKKKDESFLPRKCTLSDLLKFAEKKWDEINAVISSEQFTDKQIHSVRKHLKDLLYNLEYFKEAVTNILSLGNWHIRSVKQIEELMAELGDFQDNCKALDLLKQHCADDGKPQSQIVLAKVEKAWKLEKQRRKRSIVDALKKAVAN